jgi:polyphosphate kinase 2
MGKKNGNGKPKQPAANGALDKNDYEAALAAMQLELVRAAHWVRQTGQRVLVLLEGRDTAGKTGVINTLLKGLNPRQCNVVALGTPTETERGQWYFQRYVAHLPSLGHITLFDRSWYNRAGVERVMGFATESQVASFLRQVPDFERLLVEGGIRLFKYWLTVDQAEQERRFAERRDDPLKRWKLSPIDLEARLKYRDYGAARDVMLKATHTEQAPWTLVDFNDQKRGRLALMRDLLGRLPDTDVPVPAIDLPPLPTPAAVERLPAKFKPLTWRG